jgi:hypothetical protein
LRTRYWQRYKIALAELEGTSESIACVPHRQPDGH